MEKTKSIRVIVALLAICMLSALITVGVVFSAGVTDVLSVDHITGNPDEYIGKQVKVEGIVGLNTDHTFVLWSNLFNSSIVVQCSGAPPEGDSKRVHVTGEVTPRTLFGEERLYIIAEDWEYTS
jgi:hypothetical protein